MGAPEGAGPDAGGDDHVAAGADGGEEAAGLGVGEGREEVPPHQPGRDLGEAITQDSQGWPTFRKLTHRFDWQSLLEACSNVGPCSACGPPRGRHLSELDHHVERRAQRAAACVRSFAQSQGWSPMKN